MLPSRMIVVREDPFISGSAVSVPDATPGAPTLLEPGTDNVVAPLEIDVFDTCELGVPSDKPEALNSTLELEFGCLSWMIKSHCVRVSSRNSQLVLSKGNVGFNDKIEAGKA